MRVEFDNVTDANAIAAQHTAAMSGVVCVYEVEDNGARKYVAAAQVEYVADGVLLATYRGGELES